MTSIYTQKYSTIFTTAEEISIAEKIHWLVQKEIRSTAAAKILPENRFHSFQYSTLDIATFAAA